MVGVNPGRYSPLFLPVCKFFQSQVQVPMGSLARPVTADHTHDHTRHDEYAQYDEDRLHHISVPCMLPSTMLTAIAEMNMPASMYIKSI